MNLSVIATKIWKNFIEIPWLSDDGFKSCLFIFIIKVLYVSWLCTINAYFLLKPRFCTKIQKINGRNKYTELVKSSTKIKLFLFLYHYFLWGD